MTLYREGTDELRENAAVQSATVAHGRIDETITSLTDSQNSKTTGCYNGQEMFSMTRTLTQESDPHKEVLQAGSCTQQSTHNIDGNGVRSPWIRILTNIEAKKRGWLPRPSLCACGKMSNQTCLQDSTGKESTRPVRVCAKRGQEDDCRYEAQLDMPIVPSANATSEAQRLVVHRERDSEAQREREKVLVADLDPSLVRKLSTSTVIQHHKGIIELAVKGEDQAAYVKLLPDYLSGVSYQEDGSVWQMPMTSAWQLTTLHRRLGLDINEELDELANKSRNELNEITVTLRRWVLDVVASVQCGDAQLLRDMAAMVPARLRQCHLCSNGSGMLMALELDAVPVFLEELANLSRVQKVEGAKAAQKLFAKIPAVLTSLPSNNQPRARRHFPVRRSNSECQPYPSTKMREPMAGRTKNSVKSKVLSRGVLSGAAMHTGSAVNTGAWAKSSMNESPVAGAMNGQHDRQATAPGSRDGAHDAGVQCFEDIDWRARGIENSPGASTDPAALHGRANNFGIPGRVNYSSAPSMGPAPTFHQGSFVNEQKRQLDQIAGSVDRTALINNAWGERQPVISDAPTPVVPGIAAMPYSTAHQPYAGFHPAGDGAELSPSVPRGHDGLHVPPPPPMPFSYAQ